jgi:hypothetical protein
VAVQTISIHSLVNKYTVSAVYIYTLIWGHKSRRDDNIKKGFNSFAEVERLSKK